MNTKVSVVIPCYNSAKFVSKTIKSILLNAYQDIELEIIAVNDCSTDNTADVLKEFEGSLIIIDKDKNEGACRARNDGIRAASGEFIALCDHDDVWEPDKLFLQMQKFNDSCVGLVCSDADTFNDRGVITPSMAAKRPLMRGIIFRDLLNTNFIVQSSVVVRRNVFDEVGLFDENIFPAEDLDLWLRISQKWQADYVDKVLVHYRITPAMYSHDKVRMKQARIPVIQHYANMLNDDKYAAKVLASALQEFALDYWYCGQYQNARNKFIEASKYCITDYQNYLYILLTCLPTSFINAMRDINRTLKY